MKSHAPTSAERAEFEADIAADGYLLDVHLDWDDKNERYGSSRTQPMFSGWLLARRRAAMQTTSPDTRAAFERHFAGATFQRNSDGHPCDYMDSATESLWIGYQAGRAMQTAEPVGSNPSCECGQTREWCKANDCPDLEPAIKSLAAPDRAPSIAPDDKCTLTDAELADPAFVRAYIEGCNDSFRQVMGEIKRLTAAPSIDSAADAQVRAYMHTLEIIAVGDASDPRKAAELALIESGAWEAPAIDALQPEGGKA